MTEGEKMIEIYLDDYEWPTLPNNLYELIQEACERTLKERCRWWEREIKA